MTKGGGPIGDAVEVSTDRQACAHCERLAIALRKEHRLFRSSGATERGSVELCCRQEELMAVGVAQEPPHIFKRELVERQSAVSLANTHQRRIGGQQCDAASELVELR